MNKIGKNTILILLGLSGGLIAWPLLELVLWKQESFASFLLFIMTATLVPGFSMGFALGCGEGILSENSQRIVKGALVGLISGALGGVIGGIAGQFLLSSIISYFPGQDSVMLMMSRALSWAVVGVFAGMSEGIRSLSGRKLGFGALGGLLGGLVGGLLLEALSSYIPSSLTRLGGFLIMGTFIGLFCALFDKKFSFGVLRVLNGNQAGKKYRINQKKMDLGSGNRTIIFSDYENVTDKEMELHVDKGVITVINEQTDSTILVNDKEISTTQLKYGDVIKAGNVKLLLEAE